MRKVFPFLLASVAMLGISACAGLNSDIQKINTFVCKNQQVVNGIAIATNDTAASQAIDSTCANLAAGSAASSAAIAASK